MYWYLTSFTTRCIYDILLQVIMACDVFFRITKRSGPHCPVFLHNCCSLSRPRPLAMAALRAAYYHTYFSNFAKMKLNSASDHSCGAHPRGSSVHRRYGNVPCSSISSDPSLSPYHAAMRLPHLFTLAVAALVSVSATHHTSYTIHRRLLDPSHASSPFTPYGTVETDINVDSYALALHASTGAVVPPRGRFVSAGADGAVGEGEVNVSRAWVQVAVEIQGRHEEEWPRSAVKAVSVRSTKRFLHACVGSSGRQGRRSY